MTPQTLHDFIKLITQVVISLVLLGFGFYILLSPTANRDVEKLAAGWIGLVIGYWLK